MPSICKVCGGPAGDGLGLYCRKHKLERQSRLNRLRRAGAVALRENDDVGPLSDAELGPRLVFASKNKVKTHGGSTLEIWEKYTKEQCDE